MPTVLQASISSVPAGAVTFLPSTVSVTSAMGDLVRKNGELFDCAFFFVRAWLPIQMIFEFLAELLHERDSRHRRRIAQRTEGPPQHVLRQILHVVDIFHHAAAAMKASQRLFQPIRTLTARDTPATTLVLIKFHGTKCELHNALGIVNHPHAARP